jgi:hypothetical protein
MKEGIILEDDLNMKHEENQALDGDNRLGTLSHRIKEEHGRRLQISFKAWAMLSFTSDLVQLECFRM